MILWNWVAGLVAGLLIGAFGFGPIVTRWLERRKP